MAQRKQYRSPSLIELGHHTTLVQFDSASAMADGGYDAAAMVLLTIPRS